METGVDIAAIWRHGCTPIWGQSSYLFTPDYFIQVSCTLCFLILKKSLKRWKWHPQITQTWWGLHHAATVCFVFLSQLWTFFKLYFLIFCKLYAEYCFKIWYLNASDFESSLLLAFDKRTCHNRRNFFFVIFKLSLIVFFVLSSFIATATLMYRRSVTTKKNRPQTNIIHVLHSVTPV